MNQDKLRKIISITKKLTVLYIEDNQNVRKQTIKMLKIFFDEIKTADNGESGLELFKLNNNYEVKSFDLIITDIDMPVLDGISMIYKIRELNKDIPILVFSAYSNTDYFLKTIDAGIDGYILKPYNTEQIFNTLMNIIEKNKLSMPIENIIELENDFTWNVEESLLSKNGEQIKLTKNEIKLFTLFINSNGVLKTYDDIETYIFSDFSANNKRVRNLVSRLKTKLDYELFESIYSHGYKLKYNKIS